jgi:amidophosphoribosyltransferase
LARTIPSWQGAFSIVLLVRDGVLAARDPWGFRPLSLGRLPEGGWAVASETCALRTLGCANIREIEPGEVVSIRGEEVRSRRVLLAAETARCTFEFVYFSRPDSDWDGQNVHEVRQRLGAALAKEAPADGDVVVGVPDSSLPAAVGYARESGILFNEGLVKNRYIARTFIEPTQDMRERRVAMKYNALPSNLAGKRVVMIDDSLVRGTTAGPLVRLLREAGASEVHVRITCPPIIAPCFMGVDMGDPRELAASTRTVEQIRCQIGADSLAFLSLEAMMAAIGRTDGYCNACYTGEYPLDVADVAPKDGFEHVLG